MDIQSRKIEFIQEFLKIQSEEVISNFENLLKKEKQSSNVELRPMSTKELNARIDKSLQDSKNERVIEANELLSQIEKWA